MQGLFRRPSGIYFLRISVAEALGTTPGYWLALQSQRDLWTARQTAKERKRIKRMTLPEPIAA